MTEHMNNLLKLPGSKVLFGGKPLENHSIPKIYGALKPTAVFVPLEEILKSGNFELVTKEIFGPFQVIDSICNFFSFSFFFFLRIHLQLFNHTRK
jgi:1-pyrroline-5-carboxylate dehydrogenase